MTEADDAVWCIAANVVDERPYGPGGAQRRRGVSQFAPGAKVWVPGGFAGKGFEVVTVVGRPRGSHRFITVHLRSRFLTNWRVKQVFSPAQRGLIGRACDGGSSRFHSGLDPSSEEYRDRLLDLAGQMRRFTGEIQAGWEQRRADAEPQQANAELQPAGDQPPPRRRLIDILLRRRAERR